jgi:F-type H+-transporting ATPase subunit c
MKKAFIFLATVFASMPALAQEAVATTTTASNSGFYALAAGLAMGVAALGGALAQGKIGAAAMDGIARNPQAQGNMFVSMIIGLVLIESLVIYALVIAFLLVGKL